MAEDGYAPGTPIWVDLSSPDPAASERFYGDVLGWTADQPDEQAGGYRMLRYEGKMVAGLGPTMNPGQPPAWMTYVKVTDADATASAAESAGGKVVMAPMDVMEAGRLAMIQDTTGGIVGLWQPGQHKGAELFNRPVSMSWNELATGDVEAAKRFYSQVFGWDPHTSGEPGQEYTEWQLNGKSVGGMMAMKDVPPHWLTYFAVEDCEGTVARATERGGKVIVPATTIPQGTFSVLSDPQGAAFAVIQLNPS